MSKKLIWFTICNFAKHNPYFNNIKSKLYSGNLDKSLQDLQDLNFKDPAELAIYFQFL